MDKIKLTQKDKENILKCIATFLYKTHLEKLDNKIKKVQEEFINNITIDYLKKFNITKEIKDFADNYNIYDTITLHIINNNSSFENSLYLNRFHYSYEVNFYFMNKSAYELSFKLPYYNKLNYLNIIGEKNFCCYANNLYTESLLELANKYKEKSLQIKNDYNVFKDVINSCVYNTEIEEFIKNIPQVDEYMEQRFNKKLSTDLCTINKEKIDFVKNYLKNKK